MTVDFTTATEAFNFPGLREWEQPRGKQLEKSLLCADSYSTNVKDHLPSWHPLDPPSEGTLNYALM